MTAVTTVPPLRMPGAYEDLEQATAEAVACYAEELGADVIDPPAGPSEHFRLEVKGLPFPDRIGQGTVLVSLYRRGGRTYFRVGLEHNRVFAGTEDRMFLNDYLFCREVKEGQRPSALINSALKGVESARRALKDRRERQAAQGREILVLRVRVGVAQ